MSRKVCDKCDAILTYSWNRVGYNILRSLSCRGLKVVVGDTSDKNICSLSRYAYDSFVYPDPFFNEDRFIEILLEKIRLYNPNILIPTHDEGMIIAKHRNRFPDNLIIPIDEYDNLNRLSDKYIATLKALELGIPIPKIINRNEVVKFPVVFKTRFGNSAKGVFFPANQIELDLLKDKYKEDIAFIQEKVGGIDHSVDCIRFGDFFYATIYRAIVTKTHGGGTTTQRIIVDIPIMIQYARKILDNVNYKGVCGLDFKYDPQTGDLAFIEVNARYTGGLATPIIAGFDIPYIHYSLAVDGKYEEKINLRIGTKTKWILGDFITLIERIMTFTLNWTDVKSIFNFSFDGYDDFFSDDKKAFWGECRYYLMKLVRNRKLNP